MPDVEYTFVYPHPQAFDTLLVNAPDTVSVGRLLGQVKEEDPYLASHIGTARCTFYTVRLSFWFFRPLFTPSPALWAVY